MTQKNKTYILAKANLRSPSTEEIASLCDNIKGSNLSLSQRFNDELLMQPDLLLVESIILTTGPTGNRNDDIFLNSEILPVIQTAKYKPFNLGHNRDKIIGVMTDAYAIHPETKIRMTSEELLSVLSNHNNDLNVDIVNQAAIWSMLFEDQAKSLESRAKDGSLFVSVEAWFTHYDYMYDNTVVERTSDNHNMFDGALRANGGDGHLNGKSLKRILRNVTIGGLGAVAKPANPGSVILDVAEDKYATSNESDFYILNERIKSFSNLWTNKGGNPQMDEVNELKARIKELESALEEANGKNVQATINGLNERIQVLQSEIDGLKNLVKDKDIAITENSQKIAELDTVKSKLTQETNRANDLSVSLDTMKKEKKLHERKEKMKASVTVDDESVNFLVGQSLNMSDEDFSKYCESLSKLSAAKTTDTVDPEVVSDATGQSTASLASVLGSADDQDVLSTIMTKIL